MSSTQLLHYLWQEAINAVNGEQAVIDALQHDSSFQPNLIIAVGKAAASMCSGALSQYSATTAAIVITKKDHAQSLKNSQLPSANIKLFETGHPIPDEQSLIAGDYVLQQVSALAPNTKLLLLVSGGASALLECLPDTINLTQWQSKTQALLASGLDIAAINNQRKDLSLIKNGKLLEAFKGSDSRVYAISDVQSDALGTIGSGIGLGANNSTIIATNRKAREAIQLAAIEQGYQVIINQESLYHDVFINAEQIANCLKVAKKGVYIWGGESTIELPKQPGNGGRNQSLALALWIKLKSYHNIALLVAGTDGTDGPTNAAGGLFDTDDISCSMALQRQAIEHLQRADAGTFLEANDALLVTGATHTNVMDLVIAIVR